MQKIDYLWNPYIRSWNTFCHFCVTPSPICQLFQTSARSCRNRWIWYRYRECICQISTRILAYCRGYAARPMRTKLKNWAWKSKCLKRRSKPRSRGAVLPSRRGKVCALWYFDEHVVLMKRKSSQTQFCSTKLHERSPKGS